VTTHKTGTHEQWRAARLELLEAEKQLTRRGDELARRRQELPWVRVDKDYRFHTDEGNASLADLFRGRSQLLVYHFMFGSGYTAGCPACSAIADGFNGFAIHLAHHDVMLWAVSRAPLAKLQGYKQRMGWSFPWASSSGSDFNADSAYARGLDGLWGMYQWLDRAPRGRNEARGPGDPLNWFRRHDEYDHANRASGYAAGHRHAGRPK
jgi:predicted dithiol-disulfide oxidoreductase (DUF899 family)